MRNISFKDQILRKCQILSRDDQEELLRKYKEHQDLASLEKLFLANLRLAWSIADSFKNTELQDDLYSEAANALLYAIQHWNPQRGSLTNIATRVIKQRLSRLLREQRLPIRIPVSAQNLFQKVQRGELVDLTDSQRIRIQNITDIKNSAMDKAITQQDVLDLEDPSEVVEKREILTFVEYLDEEAKFIIKSVFGLSQPYSLTSIAAQLGICKRDVQQRLKETLEDLRNAGLCKVCNRKFQPSPGFVALCSKECIKKYTIRKLRFRACVVCGRVFVVTPPYKTVCNLNCLRFEKERLMALQNSYQ